jgi:beta-lactamase regulating signal transducer with metallopeptidase domain
MDFGRRLGWHQSPPVTPQGLPHVIEQATQPFNMSPSLAGLQSAAETSPVDWIPAVLCAVWVLGSAALVICWSRRWRGLCGALRAALPLDLNIGIRAMTSTAFAEPGVFGIRRPVLLLPSGIADRLTSPQLRAILTHELSHIRRRDNLATAIHMGLEALFWFHPLVWWRGARLR